MIVGVKNAILPVIFGLLLGFAATYLGFRDREIGPVVVRPDEGPVSAPSASTAGTEQERAMILELESRLAENPDDLILLTDIGNLYFTIQDYTRAIEYFRRGIALAPDDVNLHTDLGTALYYTEQTDEAITEFETALALRPGHPQALFNMGVVLLETRNDTAGAIELWERLIEMNPGYPQSPMVQEEIDRLR